MVYVVLLCMSFFSFNLHCNQADLVSEPASLFASSDYDDQVHIKLGMKRKSNPAKQLEQQAELLAAVKKGVKPEFTAECLRCPVVDCTTYVAPKYSHNLARHMWTQHELSYYVCKKPGCTKKFNTSALLKDHAGSMHGVAMVQKLNINGQPHCKECNDGFNSDDQRTKHLKQHENPIVCEHCGWVFFRKNRTNYLRHLAKYHSVQSNKPATGFVNQLSAAAAAAGHVHIEQAANPGQALAQNQQDSPQAFSDDSSGEQNNSADVATSSAFKPMSANDRPQRQRKQPNKFFETMQLSDSASDSDADVSTSDYEDDDNESDDANQRPKKKQKKGNIVKKKPRAVTCVVDGCGQACSNPANRRRHWLRRQGIDIPWECLAVKCTEKFDDYRHWKSHIDAHTKNKDEMLPGFELSIYTRDLPDMPILRSAFQQPEQKAQAEQVHKSTSQINNSELSPTAAVAADQPMEQLAHIQEQLAHLQEYLAQIQAEQSQNKQPNIVSVQNSFDLPVNMVDDEWPPVPQIGLLPLAGQDATDDTW